MEKELLFIYIILMYQRITRNRTFANEYCAEYFVRQTRVCSIKIRRKKIYLNDVHINLWQI